MKFPILLYPIFILLVMLRPLPGQTTPAAKGNDNSAPISGFIQENITIPVQNFDDAIIKIDNKTVVIDGYWEFKDSSGEVLEKPKIMSQPAEMKDKIVLALRSPGSATITITEGGVSKVYRVNVRARFKENDIEKELEEAIIKYTGDPGLKVAVLPPQAALVGANLRRAFGDETATEIVAPRGDVAGTSTGEVTSRNDYRPTILLEGELENDLKAMKALNIAYAYTDTVVNLMSVRNHTQVQIKVNVISASESLDSQIGVRYGTRAADGTFTTGFTLPINVKEAFGGSAPFFNIINPTNSVTGAGDIQAQINAANEKGLIKVLQSPTLTVLNGQPAEFIAGQTVSVPTSVSVSNGVAVQQFSERSVGVTLRITPIVHEELVFRPRIDGSFPFSSISAQDRRMSTLEADSNSRSRSFMNTIDENGVIRLMIQPTVNSLGDIVNGVTSFNTNVVETRVAMHHGESLVIGGLFDDSTRKTLQSVPFVEKIPIIGELFKHRDREDDRREIIFVLTPHIVGLKQIDEASRRAVTSPEVERMMQNAGINSKPVRISAREVFVREPLPTVPAPQEGKFKEVGVRPLEGGTPQQEAASPAGTESVPAPAPVEKKTSKIRAPR